MRRSLVVAAVLLLCLGNLAQADVFNMGPGLTSLETVPVGDPGNAPDMRYNLDARPEGYGAVGYGYRIGKFEVTAAQYCDFLNHKAKDNNNSSLYNSYMSDISDSCRIQRTGGTGNYTYSVADEFANRPVNYVSFWSACRFVNWLGNGQGDGDTETGAYTLNGYAGADGGTIRRNVGAKWVIPSEDEWYKAAYYSGGGIDVQYWSYPTRSDEVPGRDLTDVSGNNANYMVSYGTYPIDGDKYTTVVGEFENSIGPYGTLDQGGNVFEWNETILTASSRVFRGGAFNSTYGNMHALDRNNHVSGGPASESSSIGFRVVYIPEPPSIIALSLGLVSLLGARRRRV